MSGMKMLALAGVVVLSACGGGGAGGEDNSWLSFSPSPIEATTYAGEPGTVGVTAKSSKAIAEPLNLAVVSRTAAIEPTIEITSVSNTEYRAVLRVASTLPAGMHTGTLEVRLCRDSAITCANPYPGSPWQVPYRFTVRPSSDLRPLESLPGAAGWSTFQGDPGRTGSVPAQVNPAAFTRRFRWTHEGHVFPQDSEESVATDRGLLLLADQQPGVSNFIVRAISETNGQVAWQTQSRSGRGSLAAAGGKVYVGSLGTLSALDAATGQQLWASPIPVGSQPTTVMIRNAKLYSGFWGGVIRHDAATGAADWTANLTGGQRSWLVAADDTHVFAFGGRELCVVRPDDGAVLKRIPFAGSASIGDKQSPPVLDGQGAAFVATYGVSQSPLDWPTGQLARFDSDRSAVTWTVTKERFSSPPVLTNGVLYIINHGGNLEARSPATGVLQWTWTAPGRSPDLRWLIVVGKHAFVGGSGTTFAVDLTTRAVVWSYPEGGPMTVSSNGVLTINGKPSVVAFNLR